MSIRQSLAALTIAIAATSTMRAVEPAKAPATPAAGSARPTPPAPSANNARPNESGNPGQSTHAGDHGTDKNGGENTGDHRRDRHSNRIVYVPGYGYTNWSGDYSNPYWSTPGTWYSDDGSQPPQQSPSDGSAPAAPAAPIPPARLQEEAAQAEMTSARTRLSREFESSDEVRSALHEVQEAQHAYDAAVAEASLRLKEDPDYKQAAARKEQAARKVEAARAAEGPSVSGATTTQPAPISPEVVAAAQQKLNAASKVTAIATHDAQQDPAVNAAREKLEAAAERLNGMKARFDAALQADPQWQAAKQKLDTARAAAPR